MPFLGAPKLVIISLVLCLPKTHHPVHLSTFLLQCLLVGALSLATDNFHSKSRLFVGRNLLNEIFQWPPLPLLIFFPFNFSQLKFTPFYFYFFAATCTLRSLIHNAQIEKALKTKISLTFNDKTRTHMRLFIMCIHLAYCEFLCFICRVLNVFVIGCGFRTLWRCGMIGRIRTALPFHTPRISDSRTHPGLWSCNQEFLLKSRDELFCC